MFGCRYSVSSEPRFPGGCNLRPILRNSATTFMTTVYGIVAALQGVEARSSLRLLLLSVVGCRGGVTLRADGNWWNLPASASGYPAGLGQLAGEVLRHPTPPARLSAFYTS
jgi:hypothetical protein